MPTQPILAKMIWTQLDFESMGWHDNAVHAVALEYTPPYPGRVMVDIDYIVEWVNPRPDSSRFRFWICPATLVFEEASDFRCDEINLSKRAFELSLDRIVREPSEHQGLSLWHLDGHEFGMSVVSAGYTQYLRSDPILSDKQRLDRSQRGEPSFSTQVS